MRIFIAGPIAIKTLKPQVIEQLKAIMDKKFSIIMGDANGVDKLFQNYLNSNKYQDVKIYAINGKPRNNLGNWEVENIVVESKKKDRAYFTVKDIKMAEISDCGFMIWNGISTGTLNNMINLLKDGKSVALYFTPHDKIYKTSKLENLEKIIETCSAETIQLYNQLKNKNIKAEKKTENRKNKNYDTEQLKIFDYN